MICDLLKNRRAYVKLSGFYFETKVGPPYPDRVPVATAFWRTAPDRCVWGSDWPHPTEQVGGKVIPNDAILLDGLEAAVPDEAARRRILVENPVTLYGF
jgi:predicted TIM-barrel fold metal-dependent hydrolase